MGYSNWISTGVGLPAKGYVSSSVLHSELSVSNSAMENTSGGSQKNKQCFFCHSSGYYTKK